MRRKLFICTLLLFAAFNMCYVFAFDVPEPEYVENQLIIKYRSSGIGVNSLHSGLEKKIMELDGTILSNRSIPSQQSLSVLSASKERIILTEFRDGGSLQSISSEINKISSVEYCEPNYYVYTNSSISDEVVKAKSVLSHEVKTHGSSKSGVIVAVLDTGVDYNHSRLENNIWKNRDEIPGNNLDDDNNGYVDDVYGYNFFLYTEGESNNQVMDEHGHGTHVAGIVQGLTNDTVAGLNDDIRIMPVRFLDKYGRGTQYDAAYAIRYAVDNGAKVINCSWGYFAGNEILHDAVKYAKSKGVFVVAAAGNNDWDVPQYPAAFSEVIAVSAINSKGYKAYFSNFGDYIDLTAPGVNIYSASAGGGYCYMTGTSQAAPLVAGLMAGFAEEMGSMKNSSMVNLIYQNASDIKDPLNDGQIFVGWDKYTGYGKIDSDSTLTSILSYQGEENSSYKISANDESLKLKNVLNYPNPARIATEFGYYIEGEIADIEIRIFDMYGKEVKSISLQNQVPGDDYKRVSWNLKDRAGQRVANGTYLYTITARASDGDEVFKRSKLAVLK